MKVYVLTKILYKFDPFESYEVPIGVYLTQGSLIKAIAELEGDSYDQRTLSKEMRNYIPSDTNSYVYRWTDTPLTI